MLSFGAVIALTIFSTVSLTLDDIDSYKVEKWGNCYNVTLLSSEDNNLGEIALLPPTNKYRISEVGVSIGDIKYVASITQDIEYNVGTAEFKQHGETIGWIDIYKDHNGDIKLRNISPSLEQFTSTFHLVMAISEDPALIRKLKNPIMLDSIQGWEAFWCGVGMMGASIVATPAGGFLYGVSCGLLADMDSWHFGGVGGSGGSSTSGSTGGHGHREYYVVKIWR